MQVSSFTSVWRSDPLAIRTYNLQQAQGRCLVESMTVTVEVLTFRAGKASIHNCPPAPPPWTMSDRSQDLCRRFSTRRYLVLAHPLSGPISLSTQQRPSFLHG